VVERLHPHQREGAEEAAVAHQLRPAGVAVVQRQQEAEGVALQLPLPAEGEEQP